MKKIVMSLYLFVMTTLVAFGASDVFAQWNNSNMPGNYQNGGSFTTNTDSAGGINIKNSGKLDTREGGGLIAAIKTVINRALSMLALVALIVLLWGGRQMVSAAGDETQYKKWFTILKQAAFGLIFIWVAWLLVSGIFYFINIVTA